MPQLHRTQIYMPEHETLAPHLSLDDIYSLHKKITDETGIPLGSDRVPAAEGIDFDYKQCPYSDSPSRNAEGNLISGLEQDRLRQTYPQIRRYLLAARASYLMLPNFAIGDKLQVIDGLNILSFMHYLPSYLVNRADKPIAAQNALPRHIVVGANSASGAGGAIGGVALGKIDRDLPAGDVALQATENYHTLVGEKTVCAASSGMITKFLDLLRDGSNKYKFGDITTETNGLLSIEEFGRALVFGNRMEDLYGLRELILIMDRDYTVNLAGKVDTDVRSKIWPVLRSFYTVLSPLIAKYVKITNDLNVCLGREIEPPAERTATVWRENELNLRTLIRFRNIQ